MLNSKKGQTKTGLVLGLVMGVAFLIISVIIAFVIVTSITDTDLLTDSRTSESVVNESSAWINSTGYQLAGLDTNYVPGTIVIDSAYNNTSGDLIPSTNYSISSTGLLTNATIATYADVNVSYTYSIYSAEEQSSDNLRGNFSSGIDNVSGKIPTVMLIAAIVLVLGILILLIEAWRRMRIGGSI